MIHPEVMELYKINILERDFKKGKHHLISQREHLVMGLTIVSGSKPSPVALCNSIYRKKFETNAKYQY